LSIAATDGASLVHATARASNAWRFTTPMSSVDEQIANQIANIERSTGRSLAD